MPDFLYIHIPLCIKKCLYCDFVSVPYDLVIAEDYIDAVCCELQQKKDYLGRLKTIYIGGGTPSVLHEKDLTKLFSCIRNSFRLSPDIEITLEANPGTLNDSKLHTMINSGVNRLSIGIQSFNDNELKTLGRIHDANEALAAVELIKKAGFMNFSIDLIYGIPCQDMEAWMNNLWIAVDLSPQHISAYELTPEINTPLYSLLRTQQYKLPDEETVVEMYSFAIDYLSSHGYGQYEISNFAAHGFECIHNLNYWNRGEYVGIGAGAHSFINKIRSKNTDDVKKYIKNIKDGITTEEELLRLTSDDEAREFIFLGLRKTEGINIAAAERYGLDIVASCDELFKEGYLEVKNNNVRLTRKGMVISNTIIVNILERAGF